ncbi:MAG: methyltransferase domain-containing protein [Planctomycetia bacterium]|nr:methyltransferase domain-containing protein [Planctomycetia bacterium]
MLKRILEPEVMGTPEEALAYDQMDHAAVNRVFVDDLVAAAAARPEVLAQEVLDLGTGTAQIPVELCRRDLSYRVLAMDLSVAMLDVARLNVDEAKLREQILLCHIDAKELPFADGRFSAVISNSIVHHIPEPLAVFKEARRVLAAGGLLFLRDLVRPETEEELKRLVDTYAAGATDHQRQMFADSLRAALTLDELRGLARLAEIAADSVRATSDRHWTLSWWKPR